MASGPGVKIELVGFEEIARKLDLRPALLAGIQAGGLYVKAFLARYPPRRHGPQPARTHRQALFLKWAFATGRLDYPYRRGQSPASQSLGKKWKEQLAEGGLAVTVGNNVPYAPYVQDETRQSYYHRLTGWTTVQKVVREEGDRVRDYVSQEVEKHLNP